MMYKSNIVIGQPSLSVVVRKRMQTYEPTFASQLEMPHDRSSCEVTKGHLWEYTKGLCKTIVRLNDCRITRDGGWCHVRYIKVYMRDKSCMPFWK